MQNRNLEKLIPIVSNIIDSKLKAYKEESDKEKKKSLCHITKKFNGYFASYGPSILMAGLYQTIYSYANKEKCVNSMILEAMKEMEWIDNSKEDLKDVVKIGDNIDILLKNRILEIVVACKLAIRTFELEE